MKHNEKHEKHENYITIVNWKYLLFRYRALNILLEQIRIYNIVTDHNLSIRIVLYYSFCIKKYARIMCGDIYISLKNLEIVNKSVLSLH